MALSLSILRRKKDLAVVPAAQTASPPQTVVDMASQATGSPLSLNIEGLTARLEESQADVVTVVGDYTPESGFLYVVMALATLIQKAASWFDQNGCGDLIKTRQELKTVMRSYTFGFGNIFHEALEPWNQWLHEAIRQAITRLLDRNKARETRLKELKLSLPRQKRELYIHEWRMNAGISIVTSVDYLHFKRSLAATFVGMIFVEGMGGYDMFEFSGSSASAIAWSLINVIVLTGLSALAATQWAIVYHSRSVWQHGRGGLKAYDSDGKSFIVYPFPLSTTTLWVAKFSRGLLLAWSIGLLAYRVIGSIYNPEQFGVNAIFGAAGMVALAWGYYAWELGKAPKYPVEIQKKWQILTNQVLATEAGIANTKLIDVDAEYDKERTQVVVKYNSAVAAAKKQFKDMETSNRRLADQYMILADAYRDVYEKTLYKWFLGYVREAASLLEGQKKATREELDNTEIANRGKACLAKTVVAGLVDSNLEDQVRGFDFTIKLPDDAVIRDISAIETGAKSIVKNRIVAPGGSGFGAAPLENW